MTDVQAPYAHLRAVHPSLGGGRPDQLAAVLVSGRDAAWPGELLVTVSPTAAHLEVELYHGLWEARASGPVVVDRPDPLWCQVVAALDTTAENAAADERVRVSLTVAVSWRRAPHEGSGVLVSGSARVGFLATGALVVFEPLNPHIFNHMPAPPPTPKSRPPDRPGPV